VLLSDFRAFADPELADPAVSRLPIDALFEPVMAFELVPPAPEVPAPLVAYDPSEERGEPVAPGPASLAPPAPDAPLPPPLPPPAARDAESGAAARARANANARVLFNIQ
jgi:hypothetical protein